ncbi:MAG TPA: LacI family DNA-binding transcriptional regulator [Burkholderiaceae bacterium]
MSPPRPREPAPGESPRASIRQVAERAGVSVTTVSHALNGTRFVSDAARAKVEEAANALGYVPSEVARWLKQNTTRTLGMLVPNNSNPYFAEIIRGVERRCHAAGYSLLLCNSDDDGERQLDHLRVLAERRIDGLVLVAAGDDAQIVASCAGLRIPLVLVDREIASLRADLIEVDHAAGGELATAHLLSLGHRRVACIGGPAALRPSQQREAGWRRALARAGIKPRARELERGDFDAPSGARALTRLLQSATPPTAVFVCNDLMAIGALHAAHEAGVRVPQALSIIGFDDIELAAYTMPPLTTIAQPKQAIGTGAAEMLLERLGAGRCEPKRLILQPELRLRGSCAPP